MGAGNSQMQKATNYSESDEGNSLLSVTMQYVFSLNMRYASLYWSISRVSFQDLQSWREKEMFDMNLSSLQCSWKRLGNSSSDCENVMPEFTWRDITPENQNYFFLKAEFPKLLH
ncbi:hypothetical protein V6N12_075441 [Hibiscus sabdariffa]|uniref:Uncharacterized protein n=1 Tax=Hibiscus sabdariffa TaxID=183260 RepID=A0ABR2C938_9ROSI